MLNEITIQGRLVKDPEIRYTQTQKAIASFTVACERDLKDSNGNKQTDFIDCVAWGTKAEFVGKYFVKGMLVLVDGRLYLREWTDKDGNKRRNAEINVDGAYFCESKKTQAASRDISAADFKDADPDDGELPF